MLHEAGLFRRIGSKIYTYLYIVKRIVRGDAEDQKKRCDIQPCQAPLAAAAKFPQLSRLTGRRQPDARSIDEPSPAMPRLLEPGSPIGPDPVGMRHSVEQPAARGGRSRGFQRPVRGR